MQNVSFQIIMKPKIKFCFFNSCMFGGLWDDFKLKTNKIITYQMTTILKFTLLKLHKNKQ